MIGSLFDEASLENQENQSEFIFDADRHVETYTEEFALQKYGAFWMDYLFTMDIPEDEAGIDLYVYVLTGEVNSIQYHGKN